MFQPPIRVRSRKLCCFVCVDAFLLDSQQVYSHVGTNSCFPGFNLYLGQIFRLTRPYLNLLVKPRFFSSGFLKKTTCILKGISSFKMHKKSRKNNNLKKCVRNALIFFYLPLAMDKDITQHRRVHSYFGHSYYILSGPSESKIHTLYRAKVKAVS